MIDEDLRWIVCGQEGAKLQRPFRPTKCISPSSSIFSSPSFLLNIFISISLACILSTLHLDNLPHHGDCGSTCSSQTTKRQSDCIRCVRRPFEASRSERGRQVTSTPMQSTITHYFLEYIRLLRLHIAKGSRAGAVSSTYQHLDRSAYWRSESERMQSTLKNTQDEVVDLQREIGILKAKLDVAKLSNPTKKRKKNDDETIPYPRSPKKSKPDASSARNGAVALFDSTTEAEFSQAGEIGEQALFFRVVHTNKQTRQCSSPQSVPHACHSQESQQDESD